MAALLMDNKKDILILIEELARIMQQQQLTEIEASVGQLSARLCRTPATVNFNPSSQPATETNKNQVNMGTPVLAPTLGTFYASPSPGAKAFIQPQQHVQKGQTLGLVESMKIFYPIHAPCSGIVTHIQIKNAHSVEYHQPIMFIDTETQ